MPSPYTVVLIIPTGIGAAIGGYAGDALPVARAIAQVADCLITHPNVLNGAQLYWPLPNALYVEGYGLDQFAAGVWGLQPVRQNRIGLLLDQGIEPDLRLRHVQVADAAQATLGLHLTDYVVTDAPLGVTLNASASGATWGTIARPDSLLRAAAKLIDQAGAEAIAVVARFPDDGGSVALQNYRQGQGVDPLAGAEAVISHLIVREFHLPCAHAPALLPLPVDATVAPRSAAEELGYTFLPCVLVGLSRAPQFFRCDGNVGSVSRDENMVGGRRDEIAVSTRAGAVVAGQVNAVIVPAAACGGSAVMTLSQAGAKVIAVRDNVTKMSVPPEALGIPATLVNSYLEALGVLVCDRGGIAARSLHAQIQPLREIGG